MLEGENKMIDWQFRKKGNEKKNINGLNNSIENWADLVLS